MSRLLSLISGGGEHAPLLRDWLNNKTVHNYPITKPLLDASVCYGVTASPLPPSGAVPDLDAAEPEQFLREAHGASTGVPSSNGTAGVSQVAGQSAGAPAPGTVRTESTQPSVNSGDCGGLSHGIQNGTASEVLGMPSEGLSEMPPGAMQGMPLGAMPGMPPGGMSGMPPGAMPGMPPGGMPGMPPGGLPSGGMPGMPPGGMPPGGTPAVPPGGMPAMPPGGMPGMPPGISPNMGMTGLPSESSTETLLIPVFRRDCFVLGEMYGEVSPNALALGMLSAGSLPKQSCRRFCVDLSIDDAIEFVEYEWFTDGKLIISMHNINLDGNYDGKSVVMDYTVEQDSNTVDTAGAGLSGEGAAGGNSQRPTDATMRVIMSMKFSESVCCNTCLKRRERCACSAERFCVELPKKRNTANTSWSTWVSAFQTARTGMSINKVGFVVRTPMGEVPGEIWFRLKHLCQTGTESGVALLRRKYASRTFAETLSPAIEIEVDNSSVADAVNRVAEDVLSEVKDQLPSEVRPQEQEDVADRDVSEPVADSTLPSASREKAKGSIGKKSVTCPTCGMIFTHRGHLNVHVLTKHLKLRPFACTQCSSSFGKRSDLRRHARALHKVDGNGELVGAENAVREEKDKPFPCELCDRRYTTRQGLRKHCVKVHGGPCPSKREPEP